MPAVCALEVPTLVLNHTDRAPALARRFVAERFREWGHEDDYVGRLVVSELATNAYLHGAGFIVVRVFREERDGLAVIEVWDQGQKPLVMGSRRPRIHLGTRAVDGVPARQGLGRKNNNGRREDRMDQVRPLGARFDRRISDWRTRRGRATAERYLDLLAAAAEMQSWCHLKLYRLEDFPVPVPLLWIYTRGEDAEVGVVISVRATRGVSWAYYDAQRGWAGYIAPCGDMRAAAEQVEQLLSRPFRPV